MSYLVTGGTGFIGSRIVRELVREGQQVVAYDLFPSESLLSQLLTEKERAGVKIIRGDVNDLPCLLHTIKDNKVDVVIHMAYFLTGASNANPSLATKVNCDGTINVFEAARILDLKKVVWASSIAVYGPQEKYPEESIPNDAPHYPFGVYGACKSFDERIAAYYSEQYGLDTAALRYPIVFALGLSSAVTAPLVREMIENPAAGKPGKVPFGEITLNWIYVDDVARATVLLAKSPRTKTRVFNMSGDVRSVSEAAEYVRKLLPKADITLLPGRVPLSYRYDTTRLEEEVGFKIEWTMERGVKELINVVRREHGLPTV